MKRQLHRKRQAGEPQVAHITPCKSTHHLLQEQFQQLLHTQSSQPHKQLQIFPCISA